METLSSQGLSAEMHNPRIQEAVAFVSGHLGNGKWHLESEIIERGTEAGYGDAYQIPDGRIRDQLEDALFCLGVRHFKDERGRLWVRSCDPHPYQRDGWD
jgi:hypothetical protein